MEKPFSTETKEDVTLTNPLPMQIADWVAQRIFNRELLPGQHLKEGELATLFKTSRAPVREALYLLQLDGLVERLPRRGTVVREYSDDDIRDLYEARSTLELSTIDRLKTRWTAEARDAFETVLNGMERAISEGDSHAYSEENTHFHDTLFLFSGSKVLHRLYQQLGHPLKYLLQFSTQSRTQMERSYQEHRQIVRLLDKQEFSEAKRVLSENVQNGLSRVIELRHQIPSNMDS